ncbi:MAG: helix-turn-helix domain-containing protein, partial [Archaeoglobi archaeon]|nr:helix-turn-helix domain-containing protein [Candidatus Mnemosynella sp.]
LKEAYKEGFFETPKRIGLKEIAERRGASESAIMRTIRRGESKIISRIVKYM